MLTDQLPNAQTASEHFQAVNERLKNQFIIYGEPGPEGIKLLAPEKVTSLMRPGIEDLASADKAHTLHLTKTHHTLSDKHLIAIINQNGIFETLTWTTTPQLLNEGLRAGVFPAQTFQNPLTRMIAQLGQYKRKIFHRSVENNFIVKHNDKKLDLVNFAQDCIELLQPIYSCINNFDMSCSPQTNLQMVIAKLDYAAERAAQKLVGNIDDIQKLIDNFNTFKMHLLERINNTDNVLTPTEVQTLLRPYANSLHKPDLSLQNFLQDQLNFIMLATVKENYLMSGLFQDSSGLHKIIVDAQFTSESFSSSNIDYHNPFSAEHAFNFSSKTNNEGLVTIDLGTFGFEPASIDELAQQLALIERVDSNQPLFAKTDIERGFFGINWSGNLKAPLTWLLNGGKDILGAVLDLGYLIIKTGNNLILRLSGKTSKPAYFPSSYPIMLKTNLTAIKYATFNINKIFYPESKITKILYHSFLERMYSGVVAVFSRLLIEPLISFSNIVADELWRFKTIRKILYDSTIDTKPADETAVGLLLQQRIHEMNGNVASNTVTQVSLTKNYNTLANKTPVSSYTTIAENYNQLKLSHPPAAAIPYTVTPDNPEDFVTWFADDFLRGLIEVFSKGMYRDHPVAGLALSIATATAAPMIIPALGNNAVLGVINQNISIPIAQFLIGDTTGLLAGISTGLLQGQMAFFATEIFNGRNSLPASGLKILLENPVITSVVTLAAIGFGYTLAYQMQIPWLSALIVEETDQATFPYFELALAGAKIAAILVEGTLNLHASHHHGDTDQMVNVTLEKLRPEIKAAILKNYLKEANIEAATLSTHHHNIIESRVSEYCNKLKKEVNNPHLAGQLRLLTEVVSSTINQQNENPLSKQSQLIKFLEQQEKRHQILQLDPKILTARDKYLILNYLTQTYPSDADYVASVRNHFEREAKAGPLSETFKIILAYPGMLLRSILASFRYLSFRFEAVNLKRRQQARQAQAVHIAAYHSLQPLRDLRRKIKNDIGLLIKSVTSLLRTTWGLLGSVTMMPIMGILWLPLRWYSASAPVTLFAAFNRLVFAPGRVSRIINTIIGTMRADASTKNLALATLEMDVRYSRGLLNPDSLTRPLVANINSRTITPQEPNKILSKTELEATILDILKFEFEKSASLQIFINPLPTTLEKLTANICTELAKNLQKENLYRIVNKKTSFNKDLKAGLLATINKIKLIDHTNMVDRLSYQNMLIQLLDINRREPIHQFNKAYDGFRTFELPKKQLPPKLEKINLPLIAAQNALIELTQANIDGKLRVQAVVNLLRQHPSLSLQSVRDIMQLKKVITDSSDQTELEMAKQLLTALELAHSGARTADYWLAVYPEIVNALINDADLAITAAPNAHTPASLLKLLGFIQSSDMPVPEPLKSVDETIQDKLVVQI